MKKVLFLFVLVWMIQGCDKKLQHASKMDGSWSIYSYTQITGVGFKTEYPASGTLTFQDLGEGRLNFTEDFTYDDNGATIPMNRTGAMTITGKYGTTFEMELLTPTNVSTTNNTIHLISKDDLKIEFHENGVGHLFVLQKD